MGFSKRILESEVSDVNLQQRQDSSLLFHKMVSELNKKDIQPLKISWGQGVVILKRGDVEVKRIEEFVPVNTKKRFKDKKNHVGNYVWERYINEYFDIEEGYKLNFQKERLSYYKKALGGNPKTYVREFQACMFKAFIPEDLKVFVHNFCRTGMKREWLPKSVTNVPAKADTIRQMIKDGQQNIIPFALLSEGTTFNVSDFRNEVGKSVWKQLLKNSISRNFLICENLSKIKAGTPSQELTLPELLEYPSTILKRRNKQLGKYPLEAVMLMKKDRVLTKKDCHIKYVQTISDTKHMYRQLNKGLPKQASKWTLGKWEEKHEWCIQQINLMKYSKDIFGWIKNLHKEFQSDTGFTATILDNAFSIRTEGDIMKHCVGSYSDRSKEGKYLVVSIKDENNKNYSTLGCFIQEEENGALGATFNQHYRHCNQWVKDEDVNAFAHWLVLQINKQFKGEKYETKYEAICEQN